MTDSDDRSNSEEIAKITFPDGRVYFAELDLFNHIESIFDESGNKIDNINDLISDNVTIEYPNGNYKIGKFEDNDIVSGILRKKIQNPNYDNCYEEMEITNKTDSLFLCYLKIKKLDDESIVEINFDKDNAILTGFGKIIYPNGDIYIGHIVDDKRCGIGELVSTNENSKKGEFDKNGDLKTGILRITAPQENTFYEYEVQNNQQIDSSKKIIKTTRNSNNYIILEEEFTSDGTPTGIFKKIFYKGNKSINYIEKGHFKFGKLHGEGIEYLYNERGEISEIYESNFIFGIRFGKSKITSYKYGKIAEVREISYVPLSDKNGRISIYNSDEKISYIYEGNIVNEEPMGQGRLIIIEPETGKPLFTQVYDRNGFMESVEYAFEDGNENRIVIDYDGINRALNRNEITNLEDLINKGYIWLCDKDGNIIKIPEGFDFNNIKECARYQMQTRLMGESGELDDEKRIGNMDIGLINLIILTNIKDIESLKRVRFEIEQKNPDWPSNKYKNTENLLKSIGLTTNNSVGTIKSIFNFLTGNTEKEEPIHNLLERNINYISTTAITTAKDHAVGITVDLQKIIQALMNGEEPTNFIYGYDSSRAIGRSSYFGNLGNLTPHCQLFNHTQQELGSCGLHSVSSVKTMAENPEDIEDMRNGWGNNVVISLEQSDVDEKNTRFNQIELKQLSNIAVVSENLEIDRFGRKSDIEEFTKKGNRPRMMHQIVKKKVRKKIKEKDILTQKMHKELGKKLSRASQELDLELRQEKQPSIDMP